ncbi:hypothetical protein NL676_039307 [Syzygium grande]|nr:hypothetical protein NL676_039307 [Syzygium grande]
MEVLLGVKCNSFGLLNLRKEIKRESESFSSVVDGARTHDGLQEDAKNTFWPLSPSFYRISPPGIYNQNLTFTRIKPLNSSTITTWSLLDVVKSFCPGREWNSWD